MIWMLFLCGFSFCIWRKSKWNIQHSKRIILIAPNSWTEQHLTQINHSNCLFIQFGEEKIDNDIVLLLSSFCCPYDEWWDNERISYLHIYSFSHWHRAIESFSMRRLQWWVNNRLFVTSMQDIDNIGGNFSMLFACFGRFVESHLHLHILWA